MPKFKLGISEKNDIVVVKTKVFWLMIFRLPPDVFEDLSERMPRDQIALIHGDFLMGFDGDPLVGDFFPYRGHSWEVVGRKRFPTRFRKHEENRVSECILRYLGEKDGFEENALNDTEID